MLIILIKSQTNCSVLEYNEHNKMWLSNYLSSPLEAANVCLVCDASIF